MKTITAGDNGYNLFYLRGVIAVGKHVALNSYVEIKEKNPAAKFSRAEICIVNHVGNPGNILITDKSGITHSIYINEIELVCLEHDEVIVIWSVKNTDERGPVIAIKNLKTSQSFFFDTGLKKMYSNKWIYFFCLLISFIAGIGNNNYLCLLLIMLMGLIVAFCLKRYLSYLWADNFKRHFDFEIGW